MNFQLIDLIDFPKTQKLLENFQKAIGVPAAIIDLNGVVLVTSSWQRLCTDFHRRNESTLQRCLQSDTILANELQEGKTFSCYVCLNGLTDAVSPIIIDGQHLANMFIGQFFTEPPDLEFFRNQANEFNFDQAEYLKAVSEIPLVEKVRLPAILSFLTSFAEIIASLGLNRLKIESLARFPDENPNPVMRISGQGELLYANQSSSCLLKSLKWQSGRMIPAIWQDFVQEMFDSGSTQEIEVPCEDEVYSLLFVPILAQSDLNIYGKNITERKRAEEILRESEDDLNRAQSVAHIGSWRVSVEGSELSWSDETYRIFGIPIGTPLSLEKFLAAVHPKDRSSVVRSWKDALQGEKYDIEHRVVVGETIKWVRERAELEFDTDGNLRGGFGTVQDVSERKQMEEALLRSHEDLEIRVQERTQKLTQAMSKLEVLNQELEDFAHVASHDLQEPLRKVRVFGERLAEKCRDKLDETERDYLGRMVRASKRMQQFINDLLILSRISTKAQPFREIDLNEILSEVVQVFELKVKKSGGVIKYQNLPVIDSDETQMMQLFQNLVGNALKFQKLGQEPKINIYSAIDGENWCKIFIEDNGIGFEEQYLTEIFVPFRRLHGRNTYEGSGVGLAICRKIVERHGGQITAKSSPGEGSTFIITLPLMQPLSGEDADSPS